MRWGWDPNAKCSPKHLADDPVTQGLVKAWFEEWSSTRGKSGDLESGSSAPSGESRLQRAGGACRGCDEYSSRQLDGKDSIYVLPELDFSQQRPRPRA